MLLQDEDANRGQKESPSPPQQATQTLPFVHLKARSDQRKRCASVIVHLFYVECMSEFLKS